MSLKEHDGKAYRLADYQKYRLEDGSVNPALDTVSRQIMDLKNDECSGHQAAIVYFGALLATHTKILANGDAKIQIAIAPKSKANAPSLALESLVFYIKSPTVIYDANFLVRTADKLSAHSEGGSRDTNVHITTIASKKKIDSSIPVLLIDDVSTTGNTLAACEQILRAAGATTVVTMVVGATV